MRAELAKDSNTDKREMVRKIDAYFAEPSEFKTLAVPKIPDGSPIGMDCDY